MEYSAQARENRFLKALQAISAREALDPRANLRAVQRLTCEELGLSCSAVRIRMERDGPATLRVSWFGGAKELDLPEECWAELLDCARPAANDADGLPALEAAVGDGLGAVIGVALKIRGRVRGSVAFWGADPRPPFDRTDGDILTLAATHISTLVHIQQELNRAVLVFRRIESLEGDDFFRRAVQAASTLVRASSAWIAERDPEDELRLRTMAVWHKRALAPGFEYDVRDTPCEDVLKGRTLFVADGLARRFPGGPAQEATEADSYLGVPISDSSGHVLGVLAVTDVGPMPRSVFLERLLGDIGTRVGAAIVRARMDASLRESQQRLEVAVDAGGIAIWEIDLVRGTIRPSATAASLVGLDPSEAPTDLASWQALLHPDDLEREAARFRSATESQRSEFAADFRIRHRDGSDRWILATSRILPDPENRTTRMISAGVDITEKKKFEERLQQSEKMQNLATLAGGIAHDFNNLLMSIGGNATLALRGVVDRKVAERIQQVSIATERAAELTRQMLVYAGRDATEPKVLGLGALVRDISELLDTVISKKARLELHCSDGLAVEADPAQLRQVVMNLLTNASDALGDAAGRISVQTGRCHLDASTLTECVGGPNLKPGEFAFLRVTDTGRGMDLQTRSRMFDPFFTTKPSGRGLGMAVVIGAVVGHGGAIRVRSNPNEGSEITVFLPPTDKPIDPPMDAPEPPLRQAGSGKVLVIEDERMIRDLATSVLEEQGYEVLTAPGGRVGLELFAKHRTSLEAILLDVAMPDLSGLEVLARIREGGSTTPVILMSGFTEGDVAAPSVPPSAYLKKPFPIDALIDTLRRVTQDSVRG